MPFIKIQKLKYDENGKIESGSASIVDTIYVPGRSAHSKQSIRERLGKIIELAPDHRSGKFISPSRGLVQYDADTDCFTELSADDLDIAASNFANEPMIHVVFGDVYLLLKSVQQTGFISVLRNLFPKEEQFQRMMCHIIHGILKDGSHIGCDDFIEKSFASYVFDKILISTLRTDTRYFETMGDDRLKMKFFKSYIQYMRKKNPKFGRGCYVDSTPLPNDIKDNPFNALSCHGVKSTSIQIRLVLILDDETGMPVWFDIIAGNVHDFSTIMNVTDDVAANLDIEINTYILDAGYVSQEVVAAWHIGSDKKLVARMPAKKGYPHKGLYHAYKEAISHAKNDFIRNDNPYFGVKTTIELFKNKYPEFAYVYVDRFNALSKYRDFMLNNSEEYEILSDEDKDWYSVKNGYFVLLSNIDSTPAAILDRYFDRTYIETVFKTTKEYLNLLPLSKWNDLTIRGKLLSDVIEAIVYLDFRKVISPSGMSVSKVIGQTQSIMCFRNHDGNVQVETPKKQARLAYELFGIEVPSHIKMNEIKEHLFGRM